MCFARSQRTFHLLGLVDIKKHAAEARGMTLVVKENGASLAKPMDISVKRHRPVVVVEGVARSGAHIHLTPPPHRLRKASTIVGVRES